MSIVIRHSIFNNNNNFIFCLNKFDKKSMAQVNIMVYAYIVHKSIKIIASNENN